jgi:N-acetylglucosaminyldiphosphoundecaprenol N-acetyl-beta-D-mannosaminyltransferase
MTQGVSIVKEGYVAGGPALQLGHVRVDPVDAGGALAAIADLVGAGRGGRIFTPNVDHVVLAETDAAFRRAYESVELSLADGMPLVWAARLFGRPLPGRVAGSDLLLPLMDMAAERGWRVYLCGGAPGVAETAARRLVAERGVNVVGYAAPQVTADGGEPGDATLADIQACRPDLVVVALGTPKQELWIDHRQPLLSPAVAFGCGAGLDFYVGAQRKAPAWMASRGLEWLYRLWREPRRLWRRYLLRDPRFALVVLRTWWRRSYRVGATPSLSAR